MVFGMLYINYLRTQLNDGLKAVCTAGGTTLLDSFRNLHATQDDDGVAAFKALLQKHYPEGKSFTLLTNNPFPLYDLPDRRVSLGIQERSVQRPKGLGARVVFDEVSVLETWVKRGRTRSISVRSSIAMRAIITTPLCGLQSNWTAWPLCGVSPCLVSTGG